MTQEITEEQIMDWLDEVFDPEIPVVSLVDLGVIRSVKHIDGNNWVVKMTPTYTGCPATQIMALKAEMRLKREGINAKIDIVLSPAWTTDFLTQKGRDKLLEYGIAPPQESGDAQTLFGKGPTVPCPQCKSENTNMISHFGSTACKALYQCEDCREPFDYFKCHR